MTTDTTLLDHRFYPHLFDLVVAHAPPASLIRLRRTCHELRRRVDAIFAYSLIIHVHDKYRRGESVTTHLGLAPFLYGIGADGKLSPKAGRKPQRQAHDRLVELLEGVQVVDIVGDGAPMYPFVFQVYIKPKVVRYRSHPPSYLDQPWFSVPTVIQFCHFKQENGTPPFAMLSSTQHVSRGGVSKLIFNIAIDNSIRELPHGIIEYAVVDEIDLDRVEEMVVIFTLDTTRRRNPAWTKVRAPPGSSMGFIDELLDCILDQKESLGIVKLVNLTQLDPALLGMRGSITPDEIQERVTADSKRRADGDEQEIDFIETKVRFLTEQEYMATLSPEEEALETDPVLMGTHLVWGGE